MTEFTRLAIPQMVRSVSDADLTMKRPTPTATEGIDAPDNSELRKIAEDIAGALQYSFAAVAANPDGDIRSGTVEADIRDYMGSMKAEKRAAFSNIAAELVKASAPVRTAMFGRAGKRDAAEHLGAAKGFRGYDAGLPPLQIDAKLLGIRTADISIPRDVLKKVDGGLLIPKDLLGGMDFETFDPDLDAMDRDDSVMGAERLTDIWGEMTNGDDDAGRDFEAVVTDKLSFNITRVKCVDETNPERLLFVDLHDTIAIGGQSIDEDGDVKRINEQHVGGGFDDGDQKTYSPAWRYHWFNLREGQHWPKSYRVILMLAEKDHGGFQSLLNALYAHIRDRVKTAVANAVSGALNDLVGTAVARAIGQITAWIVDKLISWLINLFGDDVFPAKTLSVSTPSMRARWHYPNGTWGNPRSGTRTAHFYGHGGHYLVDYYWEFYA